MEGKYGYLSYELNRLEISNELNINRHIYETIFENVRYEISESCILTLIGDKVNMAYIIDDTFISEIYKEYKDVPCKEYLKHSKICRLFNNIFKKEHSELDYYVPKGWFRLSKNTPTKMTLTNYALKETI